MKEVKYYDVGTEVKDLVPLVSCAHMVATELTERLSDAVGDSKCNHDAALESIDRACGYLLMLQRRMAELALARDGVV